jgi:hypothetical protein
VNPIHEVGVHQGVEELGALTLQALRNRVSGNLAQRHRQGIGGGKAAQVVETDVRHPGAAAQFVRRGGERRADDKGGGGKAEGGDFRHRGSAGGVGGVPLRRQVPVEGAGNIRHPHRAQAEGFHHLLQVFDIAGGLRRPDQNVDLALAFPGAARRIGHQGADDGEKRVGEAGFQRPRVIRRDHRNHRHVVVFRMRGAEFPHPHLDVEALPSPQGPKSEAISAVLFRRARPSPK